MKIFQDISTLPPALQKEITHNSADMNRFYTLTTQARADVLGRICTHNSISELEKESKPE